MKPLTGPMWAALKYMKSNRGQCSYYGMNRLVGAALIRRGLVEWTPEDASLSKGRYVLTSGGILVLAGMIDSE